MTAVEGLIGQRADLHALHSHDGGFVLAGVGDPGGQQGILGLLQAFFAHVVGVVVFEGNGVDAACGQHGDVAGVGPEKEGIIPFFRVFPGSGQRTFEVDHGHIVRQKDVPDVTEGEGNIALLLFQFLLKDGGTGLHVSADGHVAGKGQGQQNGTVLFVDGQGGIPGGLGRFHGSIRFAFAVLRWNGRAIARHHVALIVVDGDGNVLLSQRKRAGQQGENQKKR